MLVEELRHAPHVLRVVARDLHAKEIFARVSTKECPFRGGSLEKAGRERHLAASDVDAKVLAHAAEGQVTYSRERRQVQLASKVDTLSASKKRRERGDASEMRQRCIGDFQRHE